MASPYRRLAVLSAISDAMSMPHMALKYHRHQSAYHQPGLLRRPRLLLSHSRRAYEVPTITRATRLDIYTCQIQRYHADDFRGRRLLYLSPPRLSFDTPTSSAPSLGREPFDAQAAKMLASRECHIFDVDFTIYFPEYSNMMPTECRRAMLTYRLFVFTPAPTRFHAKQSMLSSASIGRRTAGRREYDDFARCSQLFRASRKAMYHQTGQLHFSKHEHFPASE